MPNDTSSEGKWVKEFCSMRGHEFFCQVDAKYIGDVSNFNSLSAFVPNFQEAYKTITDIQFDADEENAQNLKTAAKLLYGLIHARYILTPEGIQKMISKYQRGEFGHCTGWLCNGQALLPIATTDELGKDTVKTYCPKCTNVFYAESEDHHIDGAFFGTTFPQKLFMMHPHLLPTEQVVSRIYLI